MTTVEMKETIVPEAEAKGELSFELLSNDNLGFTRQIVAKNEAGETIVLVDLYANITDNNATQTTNYSINIVNKQIVMENRKEVQEQVDAFLADIRSKVESIDLVSL